MSSTTEFNRNIFSCKNKLCKTGLLAIWVLTAVKKIFRAVKYRQNFYFSFLQNFLPRPLSGLDSKSSTDTPKEITLTGSGYTSSKTDRSP